MLAFHFISECLKNTYHYTFRLRVEPKAQFVHGQPRRQHLLYSESLPHRLGQDCRILSRHEREKGCGTHLHGSRDTAWVLVAAWSPWRLSVSGRRGRRLERDPGDLRVANGTDRGGRWNRATTWRRW
jgi:hypothetical protein